MPKWITLTLGIVLTMLLILVAAALTAPRLINQEQLLSDLEAEISLALGRPTRIESIGLLRLLPTPRLRLDAVQVTEGVEADAETLATVDSLRLDAAILPLISGRLVLAEVLIERPVVRLPHAISDPSATAPEGRADEDQANRSGPAQRSLLVVYQPQPSAIDAGSTSELGAAPPAQPEPANGALASDAELAASTLPPIRRLLIRDGALMGPVSSTGSNSTFSLTALNLTAGPIAAGRTGRLDATYRLQIPGTAESRGALTSTTDPPRAHASSSDAPGAERPRTETLGDEQTALSLPGLAEAEIGLDDALTELALRPLRLRFGASAGGQGPPIEIEAEALVDLVTGRVALDPFELVADRLRVLGEAELFSTPAGLGIDAQLQLPPFDLRAWLSEQVALSLPGAEDSLRRVGGQFDLQLRGPLLAIDNAVFLLDRTRGNALARLRLPQAPSASISGQLALAFDQLELDRYLPGAASAAPARRRAMPSDTVSRLLPPLPPLLEASPMELGLRLQLAAAELRLGGLGFSALELVGDLLPDSLEVDADAHFYGGWLETRFAASQLQAAVSEPGAQAQPKSPPEARVEPKAEPKSGPKSGPKSVPAGGAGADPQFAQDAGSGPELRLDAVAGSVDVAALLTDFQLGPAARAPITGLAEIDLGLNAQGVDPASVIASLGGDAALSVRDGAVTMVDLGQLIIGTIGAIGISPEDAESLTRFSTFSLSATGADGRFSSDDIQLRSNLLNIDGGGQLDLRTDQITLDLQAVMTKPPKGRGIKELEGIPIPISAAGPWADPRWEVDVRTALDAAARRALQEDSGFLDEIEERTGIKGLGDGLRQILPGLLGR